MSKHRSEEPEKMSKIILLQDNARPHTANLTMATMAKKS
jgi:hypothetical protein